MNNSLLEELLDWAKGLQSDYEEKLDTFADSAKDFIDTFIERAEEI